MASTVLIVEDDQRIASVVKFHLERESLTCHHAGDGDKGLELYEELKPDLVILDVMLPGRSGFDVCQAIRSGGGVQPAILMLTARVEEVDAVMGLTVGADDYVRKPFGVKELVARVRSLLQRREARLGAQATGQDRPSAAVTGSDPLDSGEEETVATPEPLLRPPLRIDPGRREVQVKGELIELTPTEFDLIYFMARRPGRVFTREELLDHVWGYDHAGYARTIDSHIARVRRKVAEAGGPRDIIQTVFRVGYRYRDDPDD
ncbi:MAG TPA: DNA-binding response regulator [Deltaproteobacteria bacterium]|nr:DNA-binding response regulator [Deltaproteobacteria bacterium]HCP46168.1 DNA-binding response regulator [Deltaproteobacteria bacterium]